MSDSATKATNPITGTVWADLNDPKTYTTGGFRPRLVPPVQVLRFNRVEDDAHYRIEIDDINLERFGRFLLFLFLPCVLLFLWRVDPATVASALCAFLVSFRFMRLTGTHPDKVALRMFALFWASTAVLIAGDALVASNLTLDGDDSAAEMVGLVFAIPYFLWFGIYTRSEVLLDFVAPKLPKLSKDAVLPSICEIEVEQLRLGEIHIWEALRCLRDGRKIEHLWRSLNRGWSSKDVQGVAGRLKSAELKIQTGGELGVNAFNIAQSWIDVGREKLSDLMVDARNDLTRFNIDYAAIEIPYQSELHLDYVKSLREHLQSEAISKRNRQISFGGAGGMFLLHANPVAAVAVGAGALIAKRVLRSSVTRQLVEVEGQVKSKLEIVCSDLSMLDDIVTARVIPHYEHIVRICQNLERYRSELAAREDESASDERDRAMRLAFTVAEASYYLRMTAGN